ncbi:acyl-CoA dehydrogenase [Paenibacillus yanchengensis]|uniref:Acyl-CoA dehydrogenase n=1 Tax=Paenibacillus yanchengensis TaxID=2035833 RepID=A0ABW4YHT7_9BACL
MLEQTVVEQIRTTSLEQEASRIFDPFALDIILEQQWFKLFVPKALGGSQTPLPEALKLYEYTSWVDGSFGWATTIGSGGGYFAGYMKPDAANQIFSPANAVIAGSGSSIGTAIPVDGGYIVNGSWPYCSGSTYATTFTANCTLTKENQDDAPSPIFTITLKPDQVEIIPTWAAFGLKTTNSHTIVARDQFVPVERTFQLETQTLFLDDPFFSYPFVPFAQASFAAVGIGIAKHLLDEASQFVLDRQAAWEAAHPGRFSFVTSRIEQAKMTLHDAVSTFYAVTTASWEAHVNGETLSEQSLQQVTEVCQRAARIALHCGQQLMPYLGMSAIMENNAINQIWRDLQTACQHNMLIAFE